jgi:hypothetical protein
MKLRELLKILLYIISPHQSQIIRFVQIIYLVNHTSNVIFLYLIIKL